MWKLYVVAVEQLALGLSDWKAPVVPGHTDIGIVASVADTVVELQNTEEHIARDMAASHSAERPDLGRFDKAHAGNLGFRIALLAWMLS